jgi:hypothetical protein
MRSRRTAALCLLIAACSSETSDSFSGDEQANGQLDSGLAEPDAATTEPDDAGRDAAEPDAALADAGRPELDASQPSRTALVLASGSLARCAGTSLAITWQGEPSLPPLSVTGVPAGVAYTVTAEGDHAALLTLTADEQLMLDTSFTLTVQGGDGAEELAATTAQVTVPATFSVRARVLDGSRQPLAGATLTVNENLLDAPLVSDAQGEAVIEGLSGAYDLFVVPTPAGADREAIDYRGLTRCDPSFVAELAPVYRSAQLGGTLAPPAGQSFDDGALLVGGLGVGAAVFVPPSGAASSTFGITPRWFGADTSSTTLSAVWVRPGPVYAAAGSLALDLTHGQPQTGLALALDASLPSRAHTIQAELGGYDPTRAFLALFAFDVGNARIEGIHPGIGPDLGAFATSGTTGTLATTIPAGNSVLVLDADEVFGGSAATDTKALVLASAAAGGITTFTLPATPLLDDVTLTGDYRAEPATFSWAAVAGADAIIVDLPTSVRAVLPGDTTSYVTDLALARSSAPDDCIGQFHISAVFLAGYDADADADGTGRHVPRESADFAEGAGHLAGRTTAIVYSWHYYACS